METAGALSQFVRLAIHRDGPCLDPSDVGVVRVDQTARLFTEMRLRRPRRASRGDAVGVDV